MAVIKVEFRDKEFNIIKKDVVDKLVEWGLDPKEVTVPKDAIACALDDLKFYEDEERRNSVLVRLENQILG